MSRDDRSFTRRELMVRAGTAGVAAFLGTQGRERLEAEEKTPRRPQVPRRRLGKTGEQVPILLAGGGMSFDPVFDPRLAECLKHGVNYFDVADCYMDGASETQLGAFLARARRRKEAWITTKSCKHDPAGAVSVLGQSFERLQTDYVDLFFLHNLKDPARLDEEMARTAERLKKEKKIRFFGFSCHNPALPELLDKAARLGWVDAVMFKYNFRDYGDDVLNRAIDTAHKADVGLIAMKTQGAGVSFEERIRKFDGGKFTRGQAVLKAVWEDQRLAAAVSHMDTLERVKENVAAALDGGPLPQADRDALDAHARATRHLYCAGCEHLCNRAVPDGIRVGATLRYLMYHDVYGDPHTARRHFAALPESGRRIAGVDYSAAAALCPNGVDIAAHMERAAKVLA